MFSRVDLWKTLREPNFHLLVLTLIVGVALTLTWRKVWILRRTQGVQKSIIIMLSLVATTISYLFLLVCLSFPHELGADYSNRLSATIMINFGLAFVAFILSTVKKTPLRWALAIASAGLTLIWLLLGGISSAA